MYPLSYLLGLKRFSNGAWYEPTRQDDLEDCLALLELKAGDEVLELGSGDGRVVIAMAKTGAKVTGVEIDKKLVQRSNENIQQAGVAGKAKIIHADMWTLDYRAYNKVFVYQFKHAMGRMEEKLKRELKPGSVVVSNYWPFPHWEPAKRFRYAYLYQVN